MSKLILYTSKTGATETYVKWLQEGLTDCTIQNIELQPQINFSNFETIIFALPTYGGQINKREVLEKNWSQIKSKKVYLVVVGGIPQESPWSLQAFKLIKKEVRDGLKGYVKIKGLAKDPDKPMGRVEKFMMRIFLKVDPETVATDSQVHKENLKPVWEMLGSWYT
jgi:menaquinone-dependent protoporphyrinogen IX oxidase